MPVENLEHEGLAKNPNLELAQLKFLLASEQHKNDQSSKQKLMDAIRAHGWLYLFLKVHSYCHVIFCNFSFRYGTLL